MKEIIIETLVDGLKLLPFLFIAFLIIELIEHKFSKNTEKVITKSGKFGPLIGSLLGVIPQCGFSVMATNLYVTRIVSLGTLISIYLSTSDEMLPILLSENVELSIIIKILAIKVIIGMISGFVIDFILRKKEKKEISYDICDSEHCDCNHGILLSSIKHTFNIFLFIILTSFIINIILEYFGNDYLSKLFMKDSIFAPFVTSLIGLIPNCGSSVMLCKLYIEGALSLPSVVGGLLTGSGVSLLVLFKKNKPLKDNIKILLIVYSIGVISGLILTVLNVL